MLTVKTPEEAAALIEETFVQQMPEESVPLCAARSRILARDIKSHEFVPGFHRSTVDGYAVFARDTFGCSDALPALLQLTGEVQMGEAAKLSLSPGQCIAVPTGGAIPAGADAMVMLEYAEDFGAGTIGITKPAAPGLNMIFKGDDVFPEKTVLKKGRRLTAADIGALAALGIVEVPVSKRPKVGVFSTGNELVPPQETPGYGQIRNVNTALLCALCGEAGAESVDYGILEDDEALIANTLERAVGECDVVLLSGGSSVGAKDAACRVIASQGKVLFHGIAMKPGKPTILGQVREKPVFGLPGHPVAAFFVAQLFVRPLLLRLCGGRPKPYTLAARLTEAVSANHGRAQYSGVHLTERDGILYATPIHGKSGLITTLSGSDGYFSIPRNCEGLPVGSEVAVTLYF